MLTPQRKRVRNAPETRGKLVEATTRLMLRQGFAATSVDQICAEAGLTKGSFFHHFETKEAIGLEAMALFAHAGMELYAAGAAPLGDPLVELHRLLEVMAGLARTHGEQLMCMVGMLSQELAATHGTVRQACADHMNAWVEMVARLLAGAQRVHRPKVEFDAEEVAWLLYSLWQGSMLVGKTRQRPAMIIENLRHARAYVDGLFAPLGPATRPARPRAPTRG